MVWDLDGPGLLGRNTSATPALLGDFGAITYAELSHMAERLGTVLAARGAGPGRVVALRADHHLHTVMALHAIWRVGATAAPLHPDLTQREQQEALDALEPTVHIDDPGALVTGQGSSTHSERALDIFTDPYDAAAVVWTSGSMGPSKGVRLLWSGLHCVALGSQTRMGLSRSDRWLLSLSPATMGGLALVVRAAVLESGVVIRGGFDAQRFADLMDQGAFTHASLVPTQLARVLAIRADESVPETLRGILLGGAPAPAALLEEAYARGYPVYPTYGMTETTSQVATADPETARRHPGTVGSPLEGVEVRTDSAGEILVRGPTVAPGTLSGALPQRGGWYPTGDLGHIDPEGHLFVDGRLGYRIISGGVNVDPLEVERVLEEYPHVDSACVVGLPDAEWGERVVAAVATPFGKALDMQSVRDHLRERLHPTKRPKALLIVDRPLPQGRSGKRDRRAVRQMAREQSHLLVSLDDRR